MLTTEQQVFLAKSPEFQQLLEDDPILLELGRERIDRGEELLSLHEMLRGTLRIGNLTVQPITPALWAFLWVIGNRYTTDIEKVDELDTDIFMFLLAHGIRALDFELDELPVRASGFCADHGLDMLDAVRELVRTINCAFRPLEMMPMPFNVDPEARRYDADWLANITGIVARETNEPAREIIFNMPLSTCFYYYVNAERRNDTKGIICRRNPAEVNSAILERVDELGEAFCKEHMPCQQSAK